MTAPAPDATGARVARVLIDSPLPQLDRLFDYGVPEQLADSIRVGARVRVPLRSAGRVADGYVVELGDGAGYEGPLSPLEELVSSVPVLTPEIYTLARKLADRAAGTASDLVRLAVPKRMVRVEKSHLENPITARSEVERAAVEGYPAAAVDDLLTSGGRAALDAIPGLVELSGGNWVGRWALTLAQAASSVVARAQSAILAVPDHRDEEQLLAALAAVLPADRIVRLDARQSNPERYAAFLRCLGGEALAIVGNRSAVYAPAKHLGLIALWDDGDPLHAEPLAPYVHARDAALVRQELQGSALLFAGHTRTTDVERLVELGWLGELKPERVTRPRIVVTAQQGAEERLAAMARIPSSAWREARNGLDAGPVLVQVARPGYAPRLACAQCGEAATCKRCGGPLLTRERSSVPACGWCGALAVDWSCEHCSSHSFRQLGSGSVRTAEELGRAFPGARVIVSDGERNITTVDAKPALVVATRGAEPIAAGGYRAVLLLDGERMLARESLRVAEDCLRWWSNAAALAAPQAPVLLIGVGGALATALATWRPADFARSELADRRTLRFPPAVRVASVTGTEEAVAAALEHLPQAGVDVLGPVDAPKGGVRSIVRFDFAAGAEVAAALRTEIIRAATRGRRPVAGRAPATFAPPLRVRFDDPEPFA